MSAPAQLLNNSLLLLLALGLVALNGFFVASEFALVKLRQTRARELAQLKGWRGRLLGKVHSQLDVYLSACQLGITLASLGLGWVGEPAFAELLEPLLAAVGVSSPETVHAISFAVAFTIISFLHIVVGELAPKSMAIRRPEGVSLWTAAPLYLFYWLMYLPIQLLNRSANGVLRLVGLRASGHDHESTYSTSELQMILRDSHERTDSEESGVNAVLAYAADLHELEASDLMRPRRELVTLDYDASYADVRRTIQRHRYSRYPVLDQDEQAIGLVHIKDVLLEPPGEDFPTRFRALISPIQRYHEDDPAIELLRAFRAGAPHLALVVDGDDAVEGFISFEDVLEALLGDIVDEHEKQRPGQVERRIVELRDGSLLLRGDTPLFRLERALGQRIEADDAIATVAGLLMQRLDRMPAKGDRVDFGSYAITVQRAKGPRVELVRLTRDASRQAA
jgi:CBS domain containing-hemolysin-like protein